MSIPVCWGHRIQWLHSGHDRMKTVMNSKMAALKIQYGCNSESHFHIYILVYMDSRKWITSFMPTNLTSNNPLPMLVDQFTTYRKIRLNLSDQNCRLA